jgi:hypothetical protein
MAHKSVAGCPGPHLIKILLFVGNENAPSDERLSIRALVSTAGYAAGAFECCYVFAVLTLIRKYRSIPSSNSFAFALLA